MALTEYHIRAYNLEGGYRIQSVVSDASADNVIAKFAQIHKQLTHFVVNCEDDLTTYIEYKRTERGIERVL